MNRPSCSATGILARCWFPSLWPRASNVITAASAMRGICSAGPAASSSGGILRFLRCRPLSRIAGGSSAHPGRLSACSDDAVHRHPPWPRKTRQSLPRSSPPSRPARAGRRPSAARLSGAGGSPTPRRPPTRRQRVLSSGSARRADQRRRMDAMRRGEEWALADQRPRPREGTCEGLHRLQAVCP